MGSTQVVNVAKRILRYPERSESHTTCGDSSVAARPQNDGKRKQKIKIGHAGTLDPLATGVLLLAVGEATKMVEYVMDRPKAYTFTVTWGEQRDTDDAQGQVIATSDKRPTREEIEKILPQYKGVIGQVPPKFSAIKLGGERAYDLARAGQEVEIPPRPVMIYTIECTGVTPNSADFYVLCGKGTYVRSLARDMAAALGTKGYISELCRTKSGKCELGDTISLEKLEELVHKAPSTDWLYPVEWMLDDILAWSIPPGIANIIRRGNTLNLLPGHYPEAINGLKDGELVRVDEAGKLLALCEKGDASLHPVRVFNLRG